MTLPDWEDPRRVLARHCLSPKRHMSQCFLVSRSAVERIAAALEIVPGQRVVELGPGLGTLTAELLRGGARVVAIERDEDMIAVLEAELGHVCGLEVRAGDAAAIDWPALAEELDGPVAVVGNLPYAITGQILRGLTTARSSIGRAVLMVQREVRDRLLARPGTEAWGALSVFVQAAFDVTAITKVPSGSFHPRPKVDSAVVLLTPRPVPLAEETPSFRRLVRAVFDARRKTLRRALVRAGASAERVDRALAAHGVDPQIRGERLSIDTLAALAADVFDRRAPRSRPDEDT
jgi:16S rRNA (adenine1518-N6/adenine1519-N6)-dimethyltransferase